MEGSGHDRRCRQALQIPEAPSAHAIQHDTGTIPGQMGPAGGLSDGRAELCGGAFPTRQKNGAWPTTAAAEIALAAPGAWPNSLNGESELSEGRGHRFARVGANALDHGAQAVGALRRQVLAKSEFVEYRDGVGGKNLLRRVAGIKCQQDCDQSAHDMRVAVTEIVQHWCVAVAAVDLLGKPDLAGAALHLVGSGMLGFGHRSQGAAEFDDIPIAVVPIVQQRKIIPDFVDRHHVPRSIPQPYIGSRETESDIAGSKSKIVPGLICGHGTPRHSACRSFGVSVSCDAVSASEASAFSIPPIELV